MKKLKIVIVSSVFYPNLSPRSHRATELAKMLSHLGHEVVQYAVLSDYDYSDFIKKTGIDVRNLGFSSYLGNNRTNRSVFQKGLQYLFGRLVAYPEIKLIGMVKNALKKENGIDLLITVANPHAIHWGAASVKNENRRSFKYWVADCGDPFMGNPFAKPPFYFKYLEKKWCNKVDYISVPTKEAVSGYYTEFREKIRIIPQGFNFEEKNITDYVENPIPTFSYSGMVYPKLRDPSNFLDYLCNIKSAFKFIVYTNKQGMFQPYQRRLGDRLEIRKYVDHTELIRQLGSVDFLINIKNESQVQQPSKMIDYYLSQRPILEIDSHFNTVQQTFFNQFLLKDYSNRYHIDHPERFDIKNVAKEFVDLCNETKNENRTDM